MTIWSKLFGSRNNLKDIKDDYFGELKHEIRTDIYGKKIVSKNLKGKVLFDEVEVKIDLECSTGVPNKSQKDFFTFLKSEFDNLKSKIIIPLLEEKLAQWIDRQQVKVDFDSDIILREIFISDCLTKPIDWKLSLVYIPTDDYVTIKFTDFIPNENIAFNS